MHWLLPGRMVQERGTLGSLSSGPLPSSFRKHTSESLTGDFANMFYTVWFDRTPHVINVCVNRTHVLREDLALLSHNHRFRKVTLGN